MVQIFIPKPEFPEALVTSFLVDHPTEGLPDLIFTPHSKRPDYRPMRLLAIGHLDDVDSVVNELHARKFAEVHDWSLPISSRYPGEIIRYMTRYFPINYLLAICKVGKLLPTLPNLLFGELRCYLNHGKIQTPIPA